MTKEISIKKLSDLELMQSFDIRIKQYYEINKIKAVPFGIAWDIVRLRHEVLKRGIPTVY